MKNWEISNLTANSEMTWMVKLFDKDFDFIKVTNFSENNTVQNEMTSHKLGENVCETHIW